MLDVMNEATLLENTKQRFMTARRRRATPRAPAHPQEYSLPGSSQP